MHFMALIEDPGVIRCILEYLGRWAPQAMERSPPLDFASPVNVETSPNRSDNHDRVITGLFEGQCGYTVQRRSRVHPRGLLL